MKVKFFRLNIAFDNGDTLDDIARALHALADEMEGHGEADLGREWRGQHVRDEHGDRIGTWELVS